jgi:hypothetical protein
VTARCKREDIIKIYFFDMRREEVNWIQLAEEVVSCDDLTERSGSILAGNFFSS